MSQDVDRGEAINPSHRAVPKAPPLPAPRPFQGVRNAAYKIIGLPSRPPSPHRLRSEIRLPVALGALNRFAALGPSQDATLTHRTGLEMNTLAINEKGTHALVGGKEIFKTIKIENGTCLEDRNLRNAIRSTPTQASGEVRKVYSIDIADVAWAKSDYGDYIAAATTSGKIILYDLGHASLPGTLLHEHARQVHRVTFNPHRGNLLLSGSQDGSVRLWDVNGVRTFASSLPSTRKFAGAGGDGVRDVKWSPTDGVDFVFGTDDGWLSRWDIRNLKVPKIRIPAHQTTCTSVDWHPDGKHVVTAGLDKVIRIWDVSSTAKRGNKPVWEVRTPYPVTNARWRPPCESSMPNDQGARMCTQIATIYDRDHPVVHIWDLRRTALPFREFHPYSTSPTDFLWHSQDLCWSVGREGTFLQTDIHHTNKVIERRNLQTVAVSPTGHASFVTQKRHQRRTPRHMSLPKLQTPRTASMSQSPEYNLLSRSWADDSLDHSFLTVEHRRSSQSKSSRYSSATATPPSGVQSRPVLKLDDILLNRQSFTPRQPAFYGLNPLAVEESVFKVVAKAYSATVRTSLDLDITQYVQASIKECMLAAKRTGQSRLAQTWNIVAFAVERHLKKRLEMYETLNISGELPEKNDLSDSIRSVVQALLEKSSSPVTSPELSPASMRPVSSIAQALVGLETSSNVTTPMARPLPNGRHVTSVHIQLPDPDSDHDIKPLPPSLTSAAHHAARNANEDTRNGTQLTHENLLAMQSQRTTPIPIEHNNGRIWSPQSKPLLNLEAAGKQVRPSLLKHDSDESFSFLVGSNSSRDQSMSASPQDDNTGSMVKERSTRPLLRVNSISPEQFPSGTGSYFDSRDVESSPPISKHRHDLTTSHDTLDQTINQSMILEKPHKLHYEIERLQASAVVDVEEEEMFKLGEMLHELITYYCNRDAQTATQLLLMLVPLLPTEATPSKEILEAMLASYVDATTNEQIRGIPDLLDKAYSQIIAAGINPLQLESILSTYHEQLVAYELHEEAAALRKLMHPAFPAVFDYDLGNDNLLLACGSCGGQISTIQGQLRCGSCASWQTPCAICLCNESPFGGDQSSTLITACLLCSHNTHMACAQEWFNGLNGHGCPTEGCGCICVV